MPTRRTAPAGRKMKPRGQAAASTVVAELARSSTIHIHAVLYPEDGRWIAQGLQYDLAAQGDSPMEASRRLVTKIGAEVAISMELKREFAVAVDRAPQEFWRLYDEAKMEATIAAVPLRAGTAAFQVVPHMKIADKSAHKRRVRKLPEAA